MADGTDPVHVGCLATGAPGGDLGREPAGCADDRRILGHGPREAVVDQHRRAVGPHPDVRRLHVAVHHAIGGVGAGGPVQMIDRSGDAGEHPEDPPLVLSLRRLPERRSLDPVRHDVADVEIGGIGVLLVGERCADEGAAHCHEVGSVDLGQEPETLVDLGELLGATLEQQFERDLVAVVGRPGIDDHGAVDPALDTATGLVERPTSRRVDLISPRRIRRARPQPLVHVPSPARCRPVQLDAASPLSPRSRGMSPWLIAASTTWMRMSSTSGSSMRRR